MDSKLVVEQMSGRWKIKHPDMRPLAMEANRLAPFGTTYTWVPREQNKHADRLANEALDGKRNGVTVAGEAAEDAVAHRGDREPGARPPRRRRSGGWSPPRATPTTLILVRHGVTAHTRRSGSPAASAATTPGSATRAATRSGRRPTG